jgi:hypothetical protein
MAAPQDSLDQLSDGELDALIRAAVAELTSRGTTESFGMLVALSGLVGTRLGEAARLVAERGSWSQVAQISGTTKQAAWSRWR